MKIQHLLFFILALNFQFLFSQDSYLSTITIPDSLKQNANSVVRLYNTDIQMLSSKQMIITYKKAITILNKLGDDEATLVVHYDKSNDIKKLKAYVFDAFGKEDKKISKKDFGDFSSNDGISLFNDGRLKHYKHVPTSYPYTFYYEYVIESSNTAFIPPWFLFDAFNQSVEQSTFRISFPNDIKLQKVEKNFENFIIKSSTGNNNISYEANGLKSISREQLSPSVYDILPWVRLATNKFRLEGVDGVANNWQEFGKWMHDHLIASRTSLPATTKAKVKQLVKGVEDPVDRAKIIYQYVQDKTRYISVQVGIGGWMPMLASDVDKLSYGDCKALTNYTKSLMDEAGVESYYTAVHADEPKLDMEKDVVSVQGNHVFLYLPTKEKDIWLECTSQKVPFGYQGTFTDDRDVLVITPEGGKIVHTGIYDINNNYQKTIASYKVSDDGSIEADVNINTGGIQYDDHYVLEGKSKKDIEKYYKNRYWSYINNLHITNYSFNNIKDSVVFKENVKIKATNYATFSGDRMLFVGNALNRFSSVPKRYRNRKLPLEITRSFIDTDSFSITIPENYTIEALPKSVIIENKFGKYVISIEKTSDNTLKYNRSLLLKKGVHPANDFKEYRNFRKVIAKNDKSKIVLIKK